MKGFGDSFKIFDSMPSPSSDTFDSGLKAKVGTDGKDYSIILYSPNLHLAGSLDNTGSDSSSSYSTSITRGFTFSMSQSLSISSTVGVSIEIVTASVTTTFSLSFSETWNTSETKSVSVDCPAGKKAFIYQGVLDSRVMVYDSANGDYAWYTEEGKAMTEVLVTRDQAILHEGAAPPSVPVTYKG